METVMVQLTRLSHRPFVLNCDLIELIETTPDTVISLTTGQKLVVCETPEQIIYRVKEYKRSIMQSTPLPEVEANGGI
jgi:flagellar protein FlbD